MSFRHRRPERDAGRPRRVEPQDGGGELPRPLAPCPPLPTSSGPPATASTTCHSLSDRWAPCTTSQTVGTCVCSSATRPAGPSTLGLSRRCMGGWAEPHPLASAPLPEGGRGVWWGPEGMSSMERGPRCEGTQGRARGTLVAGVGRQALVSLLRTGGVPRCARWEASAWASSKLLLVGARGQHVGRWMLGPGNGLGKAFGQQDFPDGTWGRWEVSKGQAVGSHRWTLGGGRCQ